MTDQERDQNGPGVTPVDQHGWQPSGLLRLARLCRKELREIVRDRRTIFTLILMPLLAYPLLSMAFQSLVLSTGPTTGRVVYLAGVESRAAERRLRLYFEFGERLLREQERQSPPDQRPTAADRTTAAPSTDAAVEAPVVRFLVTSDLEKGVADGLVDFGVRLETVGSRRMLGGLRPIRVRWLVRENSPLSKAGVDYLDQRLKQLNTAYVRRQLAAAGATPRLPVETDYEPIEGADQSMSLTAFVPLILILMTITGAVYPAIDLTAGERERETLETLMAAPVPRFGLLVAKYVAVVTVAMLTATANLVAMSITLIVSGMGPLVFGPNGPTLALFHQVFVLLMLFAAFFSAILLAITSFARSFKEAQSYLIPLMLLTLAPGIMSLMPDLEFTGLLAITPLLNIVLLARDLLEGAVDPRLATAAVLSTLFYAVAALSLAARIFGTDAVLYGSQATWSDLMRRPDRQRDLPSMSGAMFCLAFIYPCYFLLANSLHRIAGLTMTARLMLSAVVTFFLFVSLPLIAATLQRTRFANTFAFRSFDWLSALGAVLLGMALWPFAHEVYLLNQALGLRSLDADKFESVQMLLESWQNISPLIILLTLAVAPAVCEEFFFRGYLLQALKQSMPRWVSVVVSAVLFGVFHVITTSMLATERFLPSTFLGLVLGWVCLRTGSVIPGMLLHGMHNGLLLMISYYRDQIMRLGWGIAEQQTHMPLSWLAAAAVATAVGIVLVRISSGRR